jgi:predicted RNA-binding Zn-ribbon protein involved in translation (DUF1610 family)
MGRRGLKPRPNGWTIADIMRLAFGFAILFWLARFDTVRRPYEARMLLLLIASLVVLLAMRVLHSTRCPTCGRGPIGRMAVVPFGLHYYRCASCGQRLKRSRWLGTPWDASGIEDDAFFQTRARPVETWRDEAEFQPIFTPQTKTVASLLRDKIDRRSQAPETVILIPGELGATPEAGTLPAHESFPPERRPWRGVKASVANALFRTWDAIRWARHSQS